MSWLVPEVRVGDISLPMIRQCDSVDDPSASEEGDCSFSISRDCADDGNNTMETGFQEQLEEERHQEQRPQQLTWCVMSDDDDNNDGQNENRGNLPREGALQLMMSGTTAITTSSTSAGLGSSLLAVPWQVPRRRHSWICRYLV